MITKVVKIALFLMLFISVLSCESDINEIGVGIIDNTIFIKKTYDSKVISYNQNIIKRKANNLAQYLLGTYRSNTFGQLETSITTQLIPTTKIDFGKKPVIDTVMLDIPYKVTKKKNNSNGTPNFKLDSVLGKETIAYNLKVYELTTFLNTLDPSSPSDLLSYFTNQTYDFNPTALYSGLFKPNRNDTVLYVKRPEIVINKSAKIYKIDTIKNSDLSPSIKLPLKKSFFINKFLTNPAAFKSTEAFINLFKGLHIEATKATGSASIIPLNLTNANVKIYYTNTVLQDETDTDLNGDGDTKDKDVPVRKKQIAQFNFGNVTTNSYNRDYTSSSAETVLRNSDSIIGDKQLYLQGASGSIALIDLFSDNDIKTLRTKNWLFNEANLVFYVDQNMDTSIAPERLFLYNYKENTQLSDVIINGPSVFSGILERDSDDKPYKYVFRITDYISKVLKKKNPIANSKLALKVYNSSDIPSEPRFLINKILDYSWNPKGVVLHGSQSSNVNKRIKLKIIYSKIN